MNNTPDYEDNLVFPPVTGMEKELKEMVRILLKAAPQYRRWIEANYKEYLDD